MVADGLAAGANPLPERGPGLGGVAPEEAEDAGDRPEVLRGEAALPVEDGGLVDADTHRDLALQVAEIETALADMAAEGAEFRRVFGRKGLRAPQFEVAEWQRRDAPLLPAGAEILSVRPEPLHSVSVDGGQLVIWRRFVTVQEAAILGLPLRRLLQVRDMGR